MRFHLLLPAFNEEAALPRLLERLALWQSTSCHPLRVWVVDDGSEDETFKVASQGHPNLITTVLSHEANYGLGQAILTGITQILQVAEDQDILVVMDADDTHDPAVIDQFRQRLEEGADLVIASRFVGSGDDSTAPRLRRLLSRFASRLFRLALPIPGVTDFSSGYRGYRVSLLREAYEQWGERLIVEDSFACMAELLLKLRHFTRRIDEVPLELRYDRKLGPSKLRLASTVLQYLRFTVRDRLEPPPRKVELTLTTQTAGTMKART